jgi:hypothetical protein
MTAVFVNLDTILRAKYYKNLKMLHSFSLTILMPLGAHLVISKKTRTSFKVNLASLSQSQARVDPRVLLAKSTEP